MTGTREELAVLPPLPLCARRLRTGSLLHRVTPPCPTARLPRSRKWRWGRPGVPLALCREGLGAPLCRCQRNCHPAAGAGAGISLADSPPAWLAAPQPRQELFVKVSGSSTRGEYREWGSRAWGGSGQVPHGAPRPPAAVLHTLRPQTVPQARCPFPPCHPTPTRLPGSGGAVSH